MLKHGWLRGQSGYGNENDPLITEQTRARNRSFLVACFYLFFFLSTKTSLKSDVVNFES